MYLLYVVGIALVYILYKFRQYLIEYATMSYRCYFAFKRLPGPKSYPLLGSPRTYELDNAKFSYAFEEMAREYLLEDPLANGLIGMWAGPMPVLIIAKPDYVRIVLESNSLITKAVLYEPLAKWIGTGLLISTNEKWFARRKLISPTFHFNILKGYFEIFAQQGEILAQCMEKDADTETEVDLFPYIKKCAIDIICETAMGYQLNSQTGGNFQYVEDVVEISDLVWDAIRLPWNWVTPIWYATGSGFRFDKLVKRTNDFTIQVIKDRRNTLTEEGLLDEHVNEEALKKRRMIFLDMLLMAQKTHNLSDEDIREEVDTFMFEGHDTTASGMGFAVWLIGQYPQYQQRIHDEIDDVFGDSDRVPTESDMKRLVFLEWCIKEALRLFPSVSIIARKLTEDLVMDDYVFPKNMTVGIAPVISHRNPNCWQRPEEYYPEHFSPELSAGRHPYAYIPFSAGPRNCVGQKFALLEEKCVLSWLFRKYRVETVEPLPGNRPIMAVSFMTSRGSKPLEFRELTKEHFH